jgi:hypothetical protein
LYCLYAFTPRSLKSHNYGCQGEIQPLLISPPVRLVHLSALLWLGSDFGPQNAGWPSGRHDGHVSSRRTVGGLLDKTGHRHRQRRRSTMLQPCSRGVKFCDAKIYALVAGSADALEFERPRDIRQPTERNKNELGRVLIKVGLVSNGDRDVRFTPESGHVRCN